MFLDQVANFIIENTKGHTLGPAPASAADPFTGNRNDMHSHMHTVFSWRSRLKCASYPSCVLRCGTLHSGCRRWRPRTWRWSFHRWAFLNIFCYLLIWNQRYERCLCLFGQGLDDIYPGQNPQAQCLQAELILLLVKYMRCIQSTTCIHESCALIYFSIISRWQCLFLFFCSKSYNKHLLSQYGWSYVWTGEYNSDSW